MLCTQKVLHRQWCVFCCDFARNGSTQENLKNVISGIMTHASENFLQRRAAMNHWTDKANDKLNIYCKLPFSYLSMTLKTLGWWSGHMHDWWNMPGTSQHQSRAFSQPWCCSAHLRENLSWWRLSERDSYGWEWQSGIRWLSCDVATVMTVIMKTATRRTRV